MLPPDRPASPRARFREVRVSVAEADRRTLVAAALVTLCRSAGQLRLAAGPLLVDLDANPSLGQVVAAVADEDVRLEPGAGIAWSIVPGVAVLSYDAERYSEATAARLADRLARVVRWTLRAPATGALDVPLAPPRERRATRAALAAAPVVTDASVPELLVRRFAESPAAPAVGFGDETLSYGELGARAGRLAEVLRTHGAGPGTVVGIAVERSLALPVAVAGTMLAGAAYLPLERDQPADRLRYMAERAGARIAIADGELDLVDTVVAVDERGEARTLRAGARPTATAPADTAYVIFTSGSTGRPKGAILPHAGLANRLGWMQHRFGLTSEDRVLQKTPFGFDVSVWELLWPLTTGAQLILAPPGAQWNPRAIADAVNRAGVTTIHFVPSMLEAFVARVPLRELRSLRRIVCSGEALPRELAARVVAETDAAFFNLYGPTEASIDVTAWDCRTPSAAATVPIGYPIDNVQVVPLDARGRPAPHGVPGELHIGGVALAHGYANDPERTREAFVPSPWGRLYRTGDYGRVLDDGAIEFLGRIDTQVKIRGQRIELGEIESALLAHPSVRAAAAAARTFGPKDVRLVAFVEADEDDSLATKLRRHVAERLPRAMHPARYVVVEELPCTASGKVDRRRLDELYR
jgi:amino acid adenylation domain-containing protein